MDITKLFGAVLDNSDRITSFAILIFLVFALTYVVHAFATGKLATPSDHKRLLEEHKSLISKMDESTRVIDTARNELTEARILHSQAVVRIEFLERDLRVKDQTINDLTLRIAKLELESDVRRSASGAD